MWTDLFHFSLVNLPDDRMLLNIARFSSGIFFGILFLQSGLDKIFNFKSNLEYFRGHFASSNLKPAIKFLLILITIAETCTGLLIALGLVDYLFTGSFLLMFYGVMASVFTLLFLFIGQRLAADYPGAANIAIYFGVAILTVFLFVSHF